MTIHITTLSAVLSAFLLIGFIAGWKYAGFHLQNGNKKNNKNR